METWSLNEENESVQSILSGENAAVLHDLADSPDARNEKEVLSYLEEHEGYARCTNILNAVGRPNNVRVAVNNLYEGGIIDGKPKDERYLLISTGDINKLDPERPEVAGSPMFHSWQGELYDAFK